MSKTLHLLKFSFLMLFCIPMFLIMQDSIAKYWMLLIISMGVFLIIINYIMPSNFYKNDKL
jgi:hypothetical protein